MGRARREASKLPATRAPQHQHGLVCACSVPRRAARALIPRAAGRRRDRGDLDLALSGVIVALFLPCCLAVGLLRVKSCAVWCCGRRTRSVGGQNPRRRRLVACPRRSLPHPPCLAADLWKTCPTTSERGRASDSPGTGGTRGPTAATGCGHSSSARSVPGGGKARGSAPLPKCRTPPPPTWAWAAASPHNTSPRPAASAATSRPRGRCVQTRPAPQARHSRPSLTPLLWQRCMGALCGTGLALLCTALIAFAVVLAVATPLSCPRGGCVLPPWKRWMVAIPAAVGMLCCSCLTLANCCGARHARFARFTTPYVESVIARRASQQQLGTSQDEPIHAV